MKKYLALLALVIFLISSAIFLIEEKVDTVSLPSSALILANKCEAFFNSELRHYFSPEGLKYFKSSKKRSIAYDYMAPVENGHVMLFLHGLGDDMHSLKKLEEMARADGFGILRLDLNGHGETLTKYLSENNNKLPSEFDYKDNIQDIKEMIRFLKIKKLSIVGHSYGGGIALKLAEELPKKLVYSVHVLAPYVQRIDKYLAEALQAPNFFIRSLEIAKVPKNVLDPLAQFTWNMTQTMRYFQDVSNFLLGIDRFKDYILDPIMEKTLTESYRYYFLSFMKKTKSELTNSELEFLDLRVEAAIKVTKGIRGLDYLNSTDDIGQFPKIFQVIGGEQDKLVIPKQLTEFSFRLDQYKISHENIQLTGKHSNHLFPQLMPEEVYQTILEAITRPHPK